MTDSNPADEVRSGPPAPLPFDPNDFEPFLDRLSRDVLFGLATEDIDEAARYTAWPWWRRKAEDFREWRWRIRFKRRHGRYPTPRKATR